MKENFSILLKDVSTKSLWTELARRLKVKYGKIQMSFHKGEPSNFTQLDITVPTEEIAQLNVVSST